MGKDQWITATATKGAWIAPAISVEQLSATLSLISPLWSPLLFWPACI
jgi:hypothetical protein